MPEPKPNPLAAHRTNLQARTDATTRLVEAVTVFRQEIEVTRPVLAKDVELAKVLACELKAIADSIHKEPAGHSTPFMGGALTVVADAMRAVNIDAEAPSAFERIRDFFWSRDNKAATVGEIIEATKASAAAVRQLIYNRRRDEFVKVVGPRQGDLVRYKLVELTSRPAELKKAKEEEPPPKTPPPP